MRALLKFLRWLLLGILIVAILIGGGGYLWLRGALPQTAGGIIVQGASDPIEILRDTDGVPHIYAKTEADAMFGLGYAHAQDRLWQMEFQRRIYTGTLAEVLGSGALETDKFLRTLGPARAAASAWSKASDAERKVVERYIAGVNAFISTHHGRQLPIEFTILGYEPAPWRPEDVLGWGKMLAWDLGGNWDQELLRAQLIVKLGAEKTDQLMQAASPNDPLILPDAIDSASTQPKPASQTEPLGTPALDQQIDGLLAINRTIKESLGLGGTAIGSNNWVVGGAHTASGKPLLANDPHLGAQIPSVWYLAHLDSSRLEAIGATLPGVPGIIIGHNREIAWGVTNTSPDAQDLYIEHINSQNQAEYKGAWEPLQIIDEVIKVKGQADVPLRVRISRHGPLISDVIEGSDQPLAFRWTALDDEDHTIEAFNGVARAHNWKQFTNALARYKAPMQNFVYADTDNNIGYYAPGALPIRAKGDGRLPVPGWTGEYDWQGYVPFDQLPHIYNPKRGFIVSANNKVAPNSYPYLIGSDFAAPYRAIRITELISTKPKLTPDDMAAIQADTRSAQARALLPALLQAQTTSARGRAAIELLRQWDGTIAGDSAAASIYEAWYEQIPTAIFADELGDKLWESYADEKDMIAIKVESILGGADTGWCDDIRTPAAESCAATLGTALDAGLADMAAAQGSETITSWRWDRVHQAIFPHNPFDKQEILQPIFSRRIGNGGDSFTVNVGGFRHSEPYNQYHVPSYRQIIDLADIANSRFMHTVGQSGQLISSHYADLIEHWQKVEYLPMRFEKEQVNAAAQARLILTPQDKAATPTPAQ